MIICQKENNPVELRNPREKKFLLVLNCKYWDILWPPEGAFFLVFKVFKKNLKFLKFSKLMTMGCRAEGPACADPGARNPIGVSVNYITEANFDIMYL